MRWRRQRCTAPLACRSRFSTQLRTGLGAKGTATTAGRLYVRVVELETRALQRFHEIHLGAVQIKEAGLVDEYLQIVKGIGFVEQPGAVLERHRIAEARAPA